MRLRRLDLTRYGRFTDYQVDFGERSPGTPDLHVIYGPNEAGKTTLFSAWLDLLYGIHAQSPYDFLHPYGAMRIGAALQLADGVRELVRIKKPHNSLLDEHERPVGELALHGELAGMDREAYHTLFSLDERTLEQGGESILEARGELGQLLFSASSGLADLGGRIAALRAEADRFHRPPAQSGELNDLHKELEQARQERARIDTQAARHAELAEISRAARARHDEATAARTRMQARKDEIQRILSARPWLGRLRTLREQLGPMAGLPDVPAGWVEALPALRETEIRLDTQLAAAEEEVARLAAGVTAIAVDEAGCDLARQLDGADTLRARYLTAEKDLPERRHRLAEVEQITVFHLRQIEREGETHPERLVLPASTVERLRELMEEHSGVVTAAAKAAEELAEAQHRLQVATDRLRGLADMGPASADRQHLLEHVRAALDALRASDHGARRRLAEAARREAQDALEDSLAGLLPWRGQPNQLLGMVAPEPATVQDWRNTQQALQRRADQQRPEIERLKRHCAQLAAQHDAVSRTTGLVSDQQAASIRAERDQAWAKHRSRLDGHTADLFEDKLRRDDAVVAQRFGHLTELTQLRAAASTLTVAQSDLMHAEALYNQTLLESEALARAVREGLAALSSLLPATWTLTQLEGWLARRERALQSRAAVQTASRDIKQAEDDGKAICRRLTAALAALRRPLPPNADETELAAAAQATLDMEERLRSLQQERDERRREAEMRERAHARAEARRQQWEAAWQEICAGSWLTEGGTVPAIATVRGLLGSLTELSSALQERRTLADRIDRMEKDRQLFEEVVLRLGEGAGIARDDPHAILDLVRQLEERARQAQAARARKAHETLRLDAARDSLRQLAGQKQAHHRHKQEMLAHLGVANLAEGAARLAQIATRDHVRQELAGVEQQILTSLRYATLAEAEAALDAVDQTLLETELAGITAQWEPLEQEWRDSYTAYREAQQKIEAIGGDASVARLEEEKRTLLLAISDGVQRHLRLRAGLLATETALRLYREQHRSSMMAGASKALRVISRGAYTHLTTQPDGDSEVLVAVAADRGSKLVTEMSKGTRFQLYLALRVAGYLELARTSPPVPFIADDIMETFDDFRAEETFRLFSAMARVGQVIYLTHHRHLCDIAREVCPTVQIHHLPGAQPPASAPADPQATEQSAA